MAKQFLKCKQDQVIKLCRSLYEGLIPLTGEYKNEDQALPTIADVPDKSLKEEYKRADQVFLAIGDAQEDITLDHRSTHQLNQGSNSMNRSVFSGWR